MTETCKIGYTSKPMNRLVQLQTGNPFPLELISIKDGDLTTEKEIHGKFEGHRLKGEWFNYCPEIKDYFQVEESWCIYPSMIEFLKQSSDSKLKLFIALVEKYGDGVEFVINKTLKEAIALDCNCSARSFDTALTQLHRAKTLLKTGTGTYKVNPLLIFKGDSTDRVLNMQSV